MTRLANGNIAESAAVDFNATCRQIEALGQS